MTAGLLLVAGGLAVVAMAWRGDNGLQTAANLAQVVSVVFAVPALVALFWQLRRPPAPATSPASRLDAAKEVLADAVAAQWRDEALLRSLDDPDPMPIQWQVTARGEIMDNPVGISTEPLMLFTAASDEIAELVDRFRALRRPRLVILGAAGTGKTTLAVQLVRQLLTTRKPEDPVPVLVSVAGWDTVTHPRLHQWISTRLAQDYPALRAPELGSGMAGELTVRAQVLPVLDGLDELPEHTRADVIAALNRSLGGDDQLVLTSRTEEFADAVRAVGDVVTSALVVEPDPLTPAAAAGYLRRCLPSVPSPSWELVLRELRAGDPGSALALTTRTALGLWLVRAVYLTPDADPATLLDTAEFPSGDDLRAHLFDHLVDALIATRTPSDNPDDLFRPRHRHDPEQVQNWLRYLAAYLTRDVGTRDFAWWKLARYTGAVTRRTRLRIGLAFGVSVGAVIGLAFGWPQGIMFSRWLGLTVGFGAGGLVAAVVTFTVWDSAARWPDDQPGFADLRLRGRIGRLVAMVLGTAWGASKIMVIGSLLLLGLRESFELGTSLAFSGLVIVFFVGLVGWVAFRLTTGVIRWAETPSQLKRSGTPWESWRRDRNLTVVRFAAGVLVGGGSAGLLFEASAMASVGFEAATVLVCSIAAVIFGLAAGLLAVFTGDHRAWPAYLVATHRLAGEGLLPRDLMSFLDDAHRIGLLRAVGPLYQFRHAEFQDHLA
ncbi:NACHT domain-containing protein [Amycolatopsis xylanica]|uniref:NACHT domain-containing protein n=1 Tax=Amycolatopsis xylanica TaxID=589385 RepID=A0A1H3RZW3_9PSEU|nr:NACHT domain-containing protein [Amycolatopsis xylanica]